MRNLTVGLIFSLVASVGFSASVVKTGAVTVGYDSELQVVLTKSISATLDKAGESVLEIEGEGVLKANYEEAKLTAYSRAPKKYFYYSLNLKPEVGAYGSSTLIILGRSGSTTSYCKDGANALLTGYVGDGTSRSFCVTLK